MLRRIYDAARSNRVFPFLLPVGVALIVPGLLILCFRKRLRYPYVQVPAGSLFIACGLSLSAWTIALFRRKGHGTLAPWKPTRQLVVAGPYAHTRNPMITGVLSVLFGEAILCGSLAILAWAVLFFLVNTLHFKLSEEPGLVARFGEEYAAYRTKVPMWLPRIIPWKG